MSRAAISLAVFMARAMAIWPGRVARSSHRKQNPGTPEPQRCRIEPRRVTFRHGVVEVECAVTGLRQALGVREIAPRFVDRLRIIVERGILVTRDNSAWPKCCDDVERLDPLLNAPFALSARY